MSIFVYNTYCQRVLCKWKPFRKANWKYYPVPGCNAHKEIVGTRRGGVLFERYQNRPQTAHGLYWRTHPAEYKALLDIVNR